VEPTPRLRGGIHGEGAEAGAKALLERKAREAAEAKRKPMFGHALTIAADLHFGQFRKGTTIPYVAHVLAVASLVLTHGGNEKEAIAALFHDAIEDCGPHVRARIREQFGEEVLAIVEG
jgi:(p)ppGpp synthase/HD superfamily hydrolase